MVAVADLGPDALPLSWTRADVRFPRVQRVALPLSGLTWLAYATVPVRCALPDLLNHDGLGSRLLLRGCQAGLAQSLARAGWQTLRVGIEGLVDLTGDSLQRRAVRKMARAAGRFGQVSEVPWSPDAVSRLRGLLRASRYGQHPQLRYLFRTAFDPETRLFVFADAAGHWQGAVLFTQPTPTLAVTELMARRPQAPAGVMEAIFAAAGARFRAEGCETLSLNEVPFHHLEQRLRPLERLITLIGRRLTPVYNAAGLYHFKAKFAPHWRPVYLCVYPRGALLALVDLFTVSGCLDLAVRGWQYRQRARQTGQDDGVGGVSAHIPATGSSGVGWGE